MSKKLVLLIFIGVLTLVGGVFAWRSWDNRVSAERVEAGIVKKLDAAELNLILRNQAASDAESVKAIAGNADARQTFLKGLREYLALAAAARRAGLADQTNFKINVNYKKNLYLAEAYNAHLTAQNKANYVVPSGDIEAVWQKPENEKQFNLEMDTLRQIQTETARTRGDEKTEYPKLQGGSLQKARENWARMKVLADRAQADAGFMNDPAVALRLKIVEAGILSADYLRANFAAQIKANDAEIKAYLAAHPEYDAAKKREKALDILRQVKAGADFAKLAAETSEDRNTAKKGGLYENIAPGSLWQEVETAALALDKNHIADSLIETHTGFHIVKLDKKEIKKLPNNSESVIFSVRHILLQKNFADPNNTNPEIPSPFIPADEIARTAVEREKRDKFVENIIRQNEIVLPEDFTVDLPSVGNAETNVKG